MDYLNQNPNATCSQITEYVMRQPDFHDAARQTVLESKLYDVSDSYPGFVKAVLNYVSRKTGRVEVVLEFIEVNAEALSSDILEFISNQDDFYEDGGMEYKIFFDEFKEECLQYPPNMDKIEKMIKSAGNLNSFPYDEEHSFLRDC